MEILEATPRTTYGKKVRKLRRAGYLPAVLYGHGQTSVGLTVRQKEFERLWRELGESSLLTLRIRSDAVDLEETVIIHAVSQGPLRDDVLHVDFFRVRMDQMLTVWVPLEFTGESPAVEQQGGVLVKNIHDVEVEALAMNIPRVLRVDVSSLKNFNDHITLGGITAPEGVRILGDGQAIIVAVEPPRSDAELAGLAEKPVETLEEVEVVAKPPKTPETKTESEDVREADV